MQSLGSGVIVSSDGYVLTNNHVVGDARAEVSVILADKRELPPRSSASTRRPTSRCSRSRRGNLPTMPWGDSSRLKVAEWVLAIGNPFGVFNQTVTLGIVSATGRNVEALGYEDFIQTDAAINPRQLRRRPHQRARRTGRASTPPSTARPAATRGSASPCRAIWRSDDGPADQGRRGPPRDDLRHPAAAHDDARWPSSLGAPDASGVLVTRMDSRSEGRRLRPAARRHHRRLQRHARSTPPRNSSARSPEAPIGSTRDART